jgi:hypothetical protein
MSRGAVADLARFKITHSLWSVSRAGPGLRSFEARRGGVLVQAATLPEPEQRITEAESSWPS